MIKNKILVAVKTNKTTKIFSFSTRENALSFIRELRKIDKNINYAITL